MTQEILDLIKNFETKGKLFVKGKRNSIRVFKLGNKEISIKSFKKPSFFAGIIYRFFRDSKAKRSFLHAKVLESKNIGTPKPIAFFENKSTIKLLDSYYVCEHLEADFVFKDLFERPISEIEPILLQFAKFCFTLHENGIEFLDHSPGNTLITIEEGKCNFFLVDLNRMKFHKKMDIHKRMKNLCRLTPNTEMIRIISFEYARLSSLDENYVFQLMVKYTTKFFERFDRKKRIKKRLMFWKN